ncbi:hypothetical protein TREPR_3644 [Treponema primitia ZAS-2]|uniref:Uncharacterized protein n=1 Tax=Treponema primitia (strain ATCC BAA-887 / DSM 12427 / ZAS-2) TaxID=545694 RepID=F5YQY3_TREPZ|nr:hypothetical protein [Treponema primitia]AEF87013.1 hypothetical protein TREPR_3644 [Treponema primitia ZAS-2]
MENEENVAYIAKIYPQISQDGQHCLENMAQTMLSIQQSGVLANSNYNDKIKFMAHVYPHISRQGQEYLEKIAHTMLLLQNSKESGKKAEGDLK